MEPSKTSSDLSDWQGKLLIAGMSRSGTTWLTRVLNMHPQVIAFGESMFWGREFLEPEEDGCYGPDQIQRIGKRYAKYDWAPRHGEPGELKSLKGGKLGQIIEREFAALAAEGRQTPFAVFRHLCGVVASAEEKPIGIEKTPHHAMWRDRISAACVDHRMIITVRDPYGFMLSYKHQGDRKEPLTRYRFERRYHPLACALVWRRYALAAAAAQRTSPDQVLLLDFATFRRDEDATLRQVQDFFQLEWHNIAGSIPQSNSSFPSGERPQLKPEDVFWMNCIAGRQIEALDYERRATPFAPLRIGYSLLRLSWWGVWNFFDLRQVVSGSYWQFLRKWLTGK